ncbi:MAG: hypothetical protein N3A72_07460 [bacterium]|nr:hypothetical protein [bacterium]
MVITWLLGLLHSFHHQYQSYISHIHAYAGLTSSDKSRKVLGTELPDFVAFCEQIIPENKSINWETYRSLDQLRLGYYLLYPRKLSPEPDYLIVYHAEGANAAKREYAFHPIDFSIKNPDRVIYVYAEETIRQSWISGSKTNSVSQINLFIDNDAWTNNDRIKLDIYHNDTLLRTILKNNLHTQSTPRTPFVLDPYLEVKPNTQYTFVINILTTNKGKIRMFANSKVRNPAEVAVRFGKPQPYTLCYQVFKGYTGYSRLTSYNKNAFILIPNKE